MGIKKGSRYSRVRVGNFVDPTKGIIPTLSRRRILKLTDDAEIIRHEFGIADTIEGLAYRYLNDASLWWVILDINPKYVTPINITVGDVLTIPTLASFRRAVEANGL